MLHVAKKDSVDGSDDLLPIVRSCSILPLDGTEMKMI